MTKESRVVVQLQCEAASPLRTTYQAYLDDPLPVDYQGAKLRLVDQVDFSLACLLFLQIQNHELTFL